MRRSPNWLQTFIQYVEETESPRQFWLWSALFCIGSALQRKVWLPYGIETIYPNLYIMIIAPPGRCRKGSPVGFAKRLLTDEGIQSPVFSDSPSKRSLTKALAELSTVSGFKYIRPNGEAEYRAQAPLALISKELSSFLAINPKDMIEVLTDLFDSHDVWEYTTSDKGKDKIYGPCVSCLFASTPTWIALNLPEGAIGGGFTSRFVVVPGFEKYKFVPIPTEGDPQLYSTLISDLAHINNLVGQFEFSPQADELFQSWYLTIESKVKSTHDERMHAYLERMHIIALKVAMCLSAATKDQLIIDLNNMKQAINLAEEVLHNAPQAFGSLGRSSTALITDEVRKQLKVLKKVSFGELLEINYRNTTSNELRDVILSLEQMSQVSLETTVTPRGKEKVIITWIDRKKTQQ